MAATPNLEYEKSCWNFSGGALLFSFYCGFLSFLLGLVTRPTTHNAAPSRDTNFPGILLPEFVRKAFPAGFLLEHLPVNPKGLQDLGVFLPEKFRFFFFNVDVYTQTPQRVFPAGLLWKSYNTQDSSTRKKRWRKRRKKVVVGSGWGENQRHVTAQTSLVNRTSPGSTHPSFCGEIQEVLSDFTTFQRWRSAMGTPRAALPDRGLGGTEVAETPEKGICVPSDTRDGHCPGLRGARRAGRDNGNTGETPCRAGLGCAGKSDE